MSLPAVLRPMIGQDVTLAITGLTADEDGNLTAETVGMPVIMKGRMDELSESYNTTTEEITPMDCFDDNDVIIGRSSQFVISEQLQALQIGTGTGTGGQLTGNRLRGLLNSFTYLKIVFTQKQRAGTRIEADTCYMKILGYDGTYRRGKCTGGLRVKTHPLVDSSGNYVNPFAVAVGPE